MSKNGKSTKKCNTRRADSKNDNVEQAPVKKSIKLDIGNNSPQHSYDSRVSGHSTPIHRKDYAFDIEDSPELDYRCSPILLPCTQDGGNEIAWDWQTSNSKGSNDKVKTQNNNVETPKRTKHLLKKRNSNSPLLQKPLKRKQVKRENIENIGKLAAELKALNEKMKSMQENFKNHEKNGEEKQCKLENKLSVELDDYSSDDMMADNVDKKQSKVNSITICTENKKSTNYDDLFDDSIDDSMVKCSQEIEEKLNLCKSKPTDIMELSKISEKAEASFAFEKGFHSLTMSSNSTDTSKSSSTNISGALKTYSNNSNKANFTNISNTVTHTSSGRQKQQNKSIAEFPDDSFDDCLATCLGDVKVVSKLAEYDFSPSSSSHNTNNSRKVARQAVPSTLNNKKISDNLFSKSPVQETNSRRSNPNKNSVLITDELVEQFETMNSNEAVKKLFTGKSALENRKFFKTKSLSDQCFFQNKYFGVGNKSVKTSNAGAQFQNRSALVTPSVSTTFPTVSGRNSNKNNNVQSINGMDNAHTLNRLEKVEEAGNCIIKYKSTSNLCSIKEVKESQSVQCTPEEIERKRLEAKMKLEAKRKLQQTNGRASGTPLEIPAKKWVKR